MFLEGVLNANPLQPIAKQQKTKIVETIKIRILKPVPDRYDALAFIGGMRDSDQTILADAARKFRRLLK